MTVHVGHLHVKFDERTIIDWYGAPDRLYLDSELCVPSRETAYIGIARGEYQIDSAVMIPIKPDPETPRIAKLDRPLDLISLLDTERDGKRGIWALNKKVLHSPETNYAQLSLPVSVPEEYTFSATVELPVGAPGDATLVIGLVAGPSYCTVVMKNDDCIGIEKIDELRWVHNETRLGGRFLVPGQPVKMTITVTRRGIRMELYGRTLINWSGDFQRLSVQDDWAPIDGRRLFLATGTYFRFQDIKIAPPADAPSQPEHPPFKAGSPVDLLALVDPKRDALEGTWEKDGTSLRVVGNARYSKLVVPCEVPTEYKLTMRVARESGDDLQNEALLLKLPADSSMAQVVLDGWSSTISAIGLDRVHFDDPRNGSINRLQAIPPGPSQEFVVFVRRTGLKMMNGEKRIFDWSGNPSRFSHPSDWTTIGGRIAIGSIRSRFRFEKLEIEPLEPTSFPPVPKLGIDGNLLAIIDPVRDSRKGLWKKSPEGLISSTLPGTRLCVPVVPPERYVLEADVERKQGVCQILFGLIVGGRVCNVVIGGGSGNEVGLERLDDKPFQDKVNLTHAIMPAALLPQGKRVKVRCFVLPDNVVVMCDDKEVVRWHGDPRRLSLEHYYLPPNYSETDRSQLWLGGWDSEFLIREFTLKPLGDDEAAQVAGSVALTSPSHSKAEMPTSKSIPDASSQSVKDSEKLVIVSARYGANDKYVDITARVATAAETGLLVLTVDDSLVEGDSNEPSAVPKFVSKVVHLKYRLNGEERYQSIEQNGVLLIDGRPTSAAKYPKGFRLVEARRGTGLFRESTWTDVARFLRPLIKKESLSATEDELAKVFGGKGGDSNPGTSKALFVRYQFEGQEFVTLIPGGSAVFLGDVPLLPRLVMMAFQGAEFERQRLARIEPNVDVDYGFGSPDPEVPGDNFSVRWLGTLNVPKTDVYTFFLKNDDGARLWIDGELLIDDWVDTGVGESQIKLLKKQHNIKVEYCDRQVTGSIHLEWKSDSIPREIIPASAFFHDPKVAKQLGVK